MAPTSRELVHQTLRFESPARPPRQLWVLPWAERRFPDDLAAIRRDFPEDIAHTDGHYRERPRTQGEPHRVGTYTDEWGCTFVNIQDGVIGEVKDPLVRDWEADAPLLRFPVELLTLDVEAVNRDVGSSERFRLGGGPNPFERLQFLRGTEALYLDLADPPPAMLRFLSEMHAFNCCVLERWAATDVDGLMIGDDWGAQHALLIRPRLWRELFKPLYRDYVQIAHGAGKPLFMHSDGHITDIYPDLIEIGVDAVNSQIQCMGPENLEPFAGRITFWGEIDRQNLLSFGTRAEVDAAVRAVHRHLWRNGGCIAQCDFGVGILPENVRQVFETWETLFAGPSRQGARTM